MEELQVNLATMGHIQFIVMEKGMRVKWVTVGEERAWRRWRGAGAVARVVEVVVRVHGAAAKRRWR